MSDWDLSDSEEDAQPQEKQQPPASSKQPTKTTDDWDASDSSDEEPPKETEPQIKSEPKKQDAWDESEESDDANDANGATQTKEEPKEQKEDNYDEEALQKMKKKMKNFKLKEKRKKKRKSKKKKPLPQKSIPKNQDEIIEMSSSDSSDDDTTKKKKKKKMETYEERMRTDNDILFEGHKPSKKKVAEPKKDDRVMLSGEVTIKNFPLGSSRDCENFATQITGLLDEALYREEINTSDVFIFYKQLLSAAILEKLDMVEAKELTTKMNQLLAGKQKAWHVKKNPKGKKKKKPQWIVSDKFKGGAGKRRGGHVEGQYDADEYNLFD